MGMVSYMSPEHRCAHGSRRAIVRQRGASSLLREPEIQDFDSPIDRYQNIVRLEIPMDDPRGVRSAEPICNLDSQVEKFTYVLDVADRQTSVSKSRSPALRLRCVE